MSEAWAVDGTIVVGRSYTAESFERAFAYDLVSGTMRDLGTLGGSRSWACGVSGDIVVGRSVTAEEETHAFAYDLGSGTMRDLGTLGGDESVATAVSGATVVGAAETTTGTFRAVTWQLSASSDAPYEVEYLYDPTKPKRSGATMPIKVQLLEAGGTNVSSPDLPLTVTDLSPEPDPGRGPVGQRFRFVLHGGEPAYKLNVRTRGHPPGIYTLSFTAGADEAVYTATYITK